jgi:hypothetical protein
LMRSLFPSAKENWCAEETEKAQKSVQARRAIACGLTVHQANMDRSVRT